MELVELHIGHPAAGTPCHGDTITAGAIRVAAVEVNLACTTCCQYNHLGLEYMNSIAGVVEHISTATAQFARVGIGLGYQVNGDMMFKNIDILLLLYLIYQCGVNRLAGGIGTLCDASSRPTHSPRSIEPAKALLIVELRQRRMLQRRGPVHPVVQRSAPATA